MTDKTIKSIKDTLSERPSKASTSLPKTINVSDLSEGTQDVLEYFGVEAPILLNDFCCALEDALLDSLEEYKKLKQQFEQLKKKHE